ncbi:Kv channel-interacting 2 isoform X7 [Aphelenchoides fujianensis]|nr:Kv channel-interacting 2 isoform X7 [Aphelenchoides fujianensis]
MVRDTHFTAKELKSLYRQYKAQAPTALISSSMLRSIFSEFFLRGDVEHYADLVFNAINKSKSGFITFPGVRACPFDFVPRNGGRANRVAVLPLIYAPDGKRIQISRRKPNTLDENVLRAQDLFAKFHPDLNGVIPKKDFLETCRRDDVMATSIETLQSVLVFR